MSALFDVRDADGRPCPCGCHPRLSAERGDGLDCRCTLDRLASAEASRRGSRQRPDGYGDTNYRRGQRTADLAEWHGMLIDRLSGSEAEDRLDQLAGHPALGGPELGFVAPLARQRGTVEVARKLIRDCLKELPGHQEFRAFAAEIGAGQERA